MNNLKLKIDLHVHTCYSCDATTTLRDVVVYSKKRGLNGIAITDHNTLDGALKLAQKKELIVIPGVEIDTLQGHIIALNTTTPIPPKLSPHETIQRIHEAGGIAVAPHLTAITKAGLRRQPISNFDAIEVINSMAFPFFFSSHLSRKLAIRYSLPQTAGSDSHLPQAIGRAYTIIDADPEVNDVIRAIKMGATIPIGKPISWTVRLQKVALSLKSPREGG